MRSKLLVFAVLLGVAVQGPPPPHMIAGRLSGPDGRVPSRVTVSLCPLDESGSRSCGPPLAVAADGSFTTPPVPDGTYLLAAGPPYDAAMDASIDRGVEVVTLRGRDVSGVVVHTSHYSLRGRYVMRSDNPSAAWPSHIHVLAEMVVGDRSYPGGEGETAGAPNGEFLIRNAFGPRILRAGYTLAGGSHWFPLQVLLDGVDVTDTPTDFSRHANGRLEFVFTQHPARIAGRVVDAGGRAVQGAWVVLFSADRARWTDWASTTERLQAGDGRFSTVVSPGSYLVAALPPTPYQVKPNIPPFATLAGTATAATVGDRGRTEIVVHLR